MILCERFHFVKFSGLPFVKKNNTSYDSRLSQNILSYLLYYCIPLASVGLLLGFYGHIAGTSMESGCCDADGIFLT